MESQIKTRQEALDLIFMDKYYPGHEPNFDNWKDHEVIDYAQQIERCNQKAQAWFKENEIDESHDNLR